MVTSSEPVVGRASIGASIISPAVGVAGLGLPGKGPPSVVGIGSSLRAVRCCFEGGAEGGVVVAGGASAELTDCSLGLTAAGQACCVLHPGSKAVLRGCRVEGGERAGSAHRSSGRKCSALAAEQGGSLALELSDVDVDGAQVAVEAMGPGACMAWA